ncbi:unnamed protein product [Prunus brigantina]
MMKSIGEGSGSLNKLEQVPNIGTIGTIEVHVELAGNVINEEGNEEENGEEERTEEDTDINGRRRKLEFEDSADESDKEIYESDNDDALDDNNEFDVNLQSNSGRVGNTYLPKDFVAAACEEDSDTNFEKGFDSPNYSSDVEGERRRKFPEFSKSDWDNPKFEKGMLFESKEFLKKAVKNYAVQGNYHIKFVKNDKRRITHNVKIARGKCMLLLCSLSKPYKSRRLLISTFVIETLLTHM